METKKWLQNEKNCADFNFWAIDPKCSQIVANYVAYHL